MSFLKGAGKTIGFLTLFLVTAAAIGLAVKFYQMFDEMSYDFLLDKKFQSMNELSVFIKNLTLTPNQTAQATSLIKADGFFQLSALSLSDEQLKIVEKGSEALNDINKILMSAFIVLSVVCIAGIIGGLLSMCFCKSNKNVISNNDDKIDMNGSNLSNFKFVNQNPLLQKMKSQQQ